MLRDALKVVLQIQELDVQMIRLMGIKKERIDELSRVRSLCNDVHHQVVLKEGEIIELRKQGRVMESEVAELGMKLQKLEN